MCYHLASFLMLGLVTLDNFLYFISFLSHRFIRVALFKEFIHIFYSTFYVEWL